MGWVVNSPRRLHPGSENQYPLYMGLGGSQGTSGLLRKISLQPGFNLRTFQPLAIRYTDWAIPLHLFWLKSETNNKYFVWRRLGPIDRIVFRGW